MIKLSIAELETQRPTLSPQSEIPPQPEGATYDPDDYWKLPTFASHQSPPTLAEAIAEAVSSLQALEVEELSHHIDDAEYNQLVVPEIIKHIDRVFCDLEGNIRDVLDHHLERMNAWMRDRAQADAAKPYRPDFGAAHQSLADIVEAANSYHQDVYDYIADSNLSPPVADEEPTGAAAGWPAGPGI